MISDEQKIEELLASGESPKEMLIGMASFKDNKMYKIINDIKKVYKEELEDKMKAHKTAVTSLEEKIMDHKKESEKLKDRINQLEGILSYLAAETEYLTEDDSILMSLKGIAKKNLKK